MAKIRETSTSLDQSWHSISFLSESTVWGSSIKVRIDWIIPLNDSCFELHTDCSFYWYFERPNICKVQFNFLNGRFSKSYSSKLIGLISCDKVSVEIFPAINRLFAKVICFMFDQCLFLPIDENFCNATALLVSIVSWKWDSSTSKSSKNMRCGRKARQVEIGLTQRRPHGSKLRITRSWF